MTFSMVASDESVMLSGMNSDCQLVDVVDRG